MGTLLSIDKKNIKIDKNQPRPILLYSKEISITISRLSILTELEFK